MLVKKPYAFLIKNFRPIHGVLFAMLVYLSIKLFSIYSFFSNYVSNRYYINTGSLESEYINFIMFIIAILAIIVSSIIFYLLAIKRKENKTYLVVSIYNVILIIYFMIIFNIFQDLNVNSIDMESVRLYRDFSLIMLLPEVIFSFIILGRALGFNLKQFDFKKDLEEISIDTTDNEEIELSLGNDNYKIQRYFRKLFRLIKYFIYENKLFVITACSILVLISCIFIFVKINVYDAEYKENVQVVANTIWYKVKNSYITTTNINNKEIEKGKTYLLIEINAENKLNNIYTLTRETFRLETKKGLLFPIFTLNNIFLDFGQTYSPTIINANEIKSFIVVFELNSDELMDKYTLKVKNYNDRSIGEIQVQYKNIVLNPKNINNIVDKGEYKLSVNLLLSDTILNDSILNINNYDIKDKFNEIYNECDKDNVCKDIKYVVSPNNIGKGDLTVLKLETNLKLDDSLYMKKYINSASEFLEKYAYIEYKYLDSKYITYMQAIPVKYKNDEYSYLQVSNNLKYADEIKLILLIRGIKYTIILK